ncbi:hypothetical protein niasHT_018243 [Heterodera trifolii]|uniref:Uncharacterized protein n=1 Tax=Heterodera trifolii TaxID=157864 RepID=A0ABD2L5G8_9BILA
MHNQHAAAQREARRAMAMRRWPSSVFLADSQFYWLLASPAINKDRFKIEVSDGKWEEEGSGKSEKEVKREKERGGKRGRKSDGKLEEEGRMANRRRR